MTLRLRVLCVLSLAAVSVLTPLRIVAQTGANAAKAANPAEQHFRAAQTFQLAGDLDKAAAEYRSAISQGLQQIGNLRVARSETSVGLALLDRAVQIDPSNGVAKLDLAVARFQTGDIEAARTAVEDVLHQSPNDPRALIFAGKLSFERGDFARAAERLEVALQLEPGFEVAYTLALADLAQKKPVAAGILFDEMLASSKPDASMRVLIGIAYRETGYFDQAATHFAKAADIDPKKQNIHSALGIARYLQGPEHDDEARKQFLAELSLNPADYASCYYLGLIAARSHQPTAAIEWLQKAVNAAPTSVDANIALGKEQFERGLYADASSSFRKAIASVSPDQIVAPLVVAHEWLAKSLEKLEQSELAREEFEKSQALQAKLKSGTSDADRLAASRDIQQVLRGESRPVAPLSAKESEYIREVSLLLGEAYHNLGVIDARAARFGEAADEFEQAAQFNPSIEKLDRNWGLAAFRASRYGKAIGPLARELGKYPQDASLRQMLGLSYYMTDKFSESADTFRLILDALPDNPGLLYAAGVSLVKSGDFVAGQRLLTRMLQSRDTSPELHVVIAQAYSDQSKFAEALDEYQKALTMNPKIDDAHAGIGMVYFKQGRPDDAIEEFKKELVQNPDSTLAKYQIAYIFLQQNRSADAMPLLTDVLRKNPDHGDAHYQMGKALLETGDAPGAIRHLEAAVRLQPSQAYEYYQLSLAYRRAGRVAEADSALQTFQKLKDARPPVKGSALPPN